MCTVAASATSAADAWRRCQQRGREGAPDGRVHFDDDDTTFAGVVTITILLAGRTQIINNAVALAGAR